MLVLSVSAPAIAETHWAFVAPQRPGLPQSEAKNPIDRFLNSEGDQSVRAATHTLVRRLSFDLRGLPPTPEEVAAFAADESPDAWSRLVERFLASPHFGERMAQNWLDRARYADTSGYAADRTRMTWPYRDWVIRAINENMPFDQFTIEQIAGDMLPHATQSQRVATGFHRQAMQAKGNNPRKEEFRVKTIVDRLKTTGRAWMGLSLECAECHDHMHDPISQREYYAMFAIFNNVPHLGKAYDIRGPLMQFLPEEQQAERERIDRQITGIQARQRGLEFPEEDEKLLGKWDGPHREESAERFGVTGDFTIAATIRTDGELGTIVSKYDWRGDERSYVFGVGGEADRNGVPGHLFAWVSAKTKPFEGVEIYGSFPVNDGVEREVAVIFAAGKSIRLVVDGLEDVRARIHGNAPDTVAKNARAFSVGASYSDSAKAEAFPFRGLLSNVRLFGRAFELPDSAELGELQTRRAQLEKKGIAVPVMREMARPRETHVHVRGNFKDKGERVFPGVPAVMPPIEGKIDRLSFAKWLVRRDHPLTARVAVNYLWQHFFGAGIVATPADFGRQGEPPTFPELLDWLSVEFMASGWDRKRMVRLIVNSEFYRSSAVPRTRLPAEQVRDHFLAVSGLLVPRIGGPSVFPPQPEGFYEERAQNEPGNSDFEWRASEGEGRYRKSMYIYWKRMALHPSMAALDAPPRQVCVAKRSVTNTPQQALVTLNDPMFHECAEALAKRIAEDPGSATEEARIRRAFQLCLSRDPDTEEQARFHAFLKTESWISAAAVLLNLDEALTRE